MRIGWMCAVLVVPAVASADSFVTLDRQDRTSSAGFEASYIDLKNGADATLLRFDGHAQYVTPANVGFYVTVPWSYVSGNNDTNTTIGDVEVGGIFVLPQVSPGVDLVLHAGLALPTGTTGADGVQNVVASEARFADLYLALGDSTSLRVGGSLLVHSGALVARVDLGIDANLHNSNTVDGVTTNNGDTADTYVRLDGGIGVDLAHQALLMGELVNLYDTSGNSNFSGNTLNVGALSFRYTAAQVHPYIALVLPLDDDSKSFASTSVTVGFDALMR